MVDVVNTWGMRKTFGAIGVALAIAGVGGAAIAAATDGGPDFMGGGTRGFGGPPPASQAAVVHPEALHGEYVVDDGHGGFTTNISQTGRVTAISPTAVTARSADGFVQSYVIRELGGDGVGRFAVNDEVTIDATRKGETATVSTMQPPRASSAGPGGR